MKDCFEGIHIFQHLEPVKTEHEVLCTILWEHVKHIEEASKTDEEWINKAEKVHIVTDYQPLFFLGNYQEVRKQWDAYREWKDTKRLIYN